jgi:acyl-CoA reductase-like NAD-dependent aldehyde dehydrogenase
MNDIPRLLPWIGGTASASAGAAFSPLVSPIDESVASHMIESDAGIVDEAVKHAHKAYLANQDATTAKRVEWLVAAADAMDKIEAELARSLIRVIGKPRRAATFEAKRAGTFIRACAAQLPHLLGEVLPLDVAVTGAGRFGFTVRIPYGVVAAITPFNGPVNLLIQKVAPALAVGNTVVVKPSPPGTEVALLMAEAMKKAGIPDGLFNVVPGGRETAKLLVSHPLVAAVTVTGSTAAGNELARAAGAKKFVGELGSNAANIVCADADLADAATRIAGARGKRSAMHLSAARDRRTASLRPLPRAIHHRRKETQGRRSRGRRDRCRPDGVERGRRPRRADDRGCRRQRRQARTQARTARRHPQPGDRRGGAARGAADA